jgi:predicted RNA-binding protein with PIN domain
MRLLIDGYNLMFESISVDRGMDGKNALRAARGRLLQLLVDLIDQSIRDKTMIVFDAKKAPPGLPDKYLQHGIQIVFARDWNSADELIQSEIRRHSAPKTLTVVSSDHALHRKALARGAQVIDSDEWLDRELENRARIARQGPDGPDSIAEIESEAKNRQLTEEEKKKWLKEFGG